MVAEAAKERVAGFARASAKLELRLALRDAEQGHQLDLVILRQRALEELVFPVRPPRHVENAIRPAPAIHHQLAGVVDQGAFARTPGIGRGIHRGPLLLRRDLHAVEGRAGLRGLHLETKRRGLATACRPRHDGQRGRDHRRAVRGRDDIARHGQRDGHQPRHEIFAGVARARRLHLHGHRRILERALRHVHLRDGYVAHLPVAAQQHGIDGWKFRQILRHVAQVRRDAIGEQQNARERLPGVTRRQRAQRRAERGRASVELQFAEVRRRLHA